MSAGLSQRLREERDATGLSRVRRERAGTLSPEVRDAGLWGSQIRAYLASIRYLAAWPNGAG
ncbi:hypothetical protein DSM21852_38780 [Methylocystis bryophila]|nr:hypothetical protein DSM21852_38780 [Methylocystis bryophila]